MKPLFVVIVAILQMACVKQIGKPEGALPAIKLTSPTIRIASPRDGQRVVAGQVLPVSITIADDKQLEKVRLFVTNRTTGAQVLHLEKFLDVKSYNLSESFIPAAGFMYTIKIEAVDQNNNKVETRIGVVSN